MEGKYIHYCWFGGKPLPKLAKKCLASWKKFLPDYEIILWDENKVDLNECPFLKGAYDTKSFAFVADYVRAKALNEMGGIYFDTDMEVTKDISALLQGESFLGVEDSGKIACGVWYEAHPNSYLSTKLLEHYRSYKKFDFEKRAEFAIPLLISKILEPAGFSYRKKSIQHLKHGITIYPRDYFYPYSYNRQNNIFTDNTCMIHYYDASWLPVRTRFENYLVRHMGRAEAIHFMEKAHLAKQSVRKTAKVVLFPITLYRRHARKKAEIFTLEYFQRLDATVAEIKKSADKPYIVMHNQEWLGVTSATKELFQNTVDCGELYRRADIRRVAQAIADSRVPQVIFSSMSYGYPQLAKLLHQAAPEIKIKVFWHGSISQVHDPYGWQMNTAAIDLCRAGVVSVFATCKKSLYDFYKKQGINVHFITNRVEFTPKTRKTSPAPSSTKSPRIGLYAARSTIWHKNLFANLAAASLIPNATVEIIPLTPEVADFAAYLGLKVEGVDHNLSRTELSKRMAKNNVNLYVTFTECAPMTPLESLEMGVPCITGNNHHYFHGSKLERYLVVDNEEDPYAIKQKITQCLDNRDQIIQLYNDTFRDANIQQSVEDVKEFIRM